MISLRPFRAWRPTADKAHLVGSRSYVSYKPEQLQEKLAGNPYTFLHVVHPEDQGQAMPRSERFHLVRMAFKRFCDEGVLVRDEKPCIHVYEQRSRGDVSVGIICGVSVQDLNEGRIKVHEQTLLARENLFAEYLEGTGINAEPVLLATPEGHAWEAVLDPVLGTRPDHDFTTTDRVRHRFWALDDVAMHNNLQRAFAGIPALYIADGHHRMASSARLAAQKGAHDTAPEAWCLAYIVPRQGLHIHNFDRVVEHLNGMDERSFLDALSRIGELRPANAPWAAPGVVGVRTAGGWHSLHLPAPGADADPAERLDAARLSALVLAPLLGITDLRTSPHVRFVPGMEGTATLDRMVAHEGCAVAFHLHSVSFEEMKAVADAGLTMPPKSTWIAPKLRSGLTVYGLEDV